MMRKEFKQFLEDSKATKAWKKSNPSPWAGVMGHGSTPDFESRAYNFLTQEFEKFSDDELIACIEEKVEFIQHQQRYFSPILDMVQRRIDHSKALSLSFWKNFIEIAPSNLKLEVTRKFSQYLSGNSSLDGSELDELCRVNEYGSVIKTLIEEHALGHSPDILSIYFKRFTSYWKDESKNWLRFPEHNLVEMLDSDFKAACSIMDNSLQHHLPGKVKKKFCEIAAQEMSQGNKLNRFNRYLAHLGANFHEELGKRVNMEEFWSQTMNEQIYPKHTGTAENIVQVNLLQYMIIGYGGSLWQQSRSFVEEAIRKYPHLVVASATETVNAMDYPCSAAQLAFKLEKDQSFEKINHPAFEMMCLVYEHLSIHDKKMVASEMFHGLLKPDRNISPAKSAVYVQELFQQAQVEDLAMLEKALSFWCQTLNSLDEDGQKLIEHHLLAMKLNLQEAPTLSKKPKL